MARVSAVRTGPQAVQAGEVELGDLSEGRSKYAPRAVTLSEAPTSWAESLPLVHPTLKGSLG